MTAGLTKHDRAQLFSQVVPSHFIETLDPTFGTAKVVSRLKNGGNGACGGAVGCDDGPSSDGKNAVWFTFWYDRRGHGFDVKVTKTRRRGMHEEVLRAGRVTWNELANRATFAALELKYGPMDGPRPTPQMCLF